MSKGTLIATLAVLLVGAVGGFMAGRACFRPVEPPEKQIDTLILRDTIRLSNPVYFARYVTDTMMVAVTDTIRERDTLYVSLPREVREYRDSTYACAVSGYAPRLDWIETYGTSQVITEKLTLPVKKWSIGIQGGVGVVAPFRGNIGTGGYIGVGISYKLL